MYAELRPDDVEMIDDVRVREQPITGQANYLLKDDWATYRLQGLRHCSRTGAALLTFDLVDNGCSIEVHQVVFAGVPFRIRMGQSASSVLIKHFADSNCRW